MEDVIVTREVLNLYDKYEGDFGLLDERWASSEDRQKVSGGQARLLAEYVEKLHFTMLDTVSVQLKDAVLKRMAELEKVIDREVIEILRSRLLER